MPVAFIHLSDIHFGQETGGRVVIHRDVRDRLIDDVALVVKSLSNQRADGVIVSGDIAFCGTAGEYSQAGRWLDSVAKAAGCPITQVQIVPGNHDINRNGISRSSAWMLSEIASKGEETLDAFLSDPRDREVLYARFEDYREFAEAYDCPLDREGGTAGHKVFELVPGRNLRFVGLNSALCCAKKDEIGRLLLGARQRILPRQAGEEIVVLCHHPLHWLRDSEEARRYVRSRARVFISGHEHSPKIDVDRVHQGCDLLNIASGATIPPVANEQFTFTYNVLEFDWDPVSDGLSIKIYPRIWSQGKTAFQANSEQFGDEMIPYTLGCPNFHAGAGPRVRVLTSPEAPQSPQESVTEEHDLGTDVSKGGALEEQFSFLLLRFFRDLTAAQRLAILVTLGALPQNWSGVLTHAMERRAVDALKTTGKLPELASKIKQALEEVPNVEAK